ncbi:hypothetical protein ACFYON_16360 [Micromonospora sp. NPDC005686]|uniref:hypothetical protein n=1 Tax=Micromonospora sp. NPDC005686 TaxID=3364233 RepID=UPI0036B26A1A
MKAFEITATLLASLAWPMVVVFLVIVFRKPIKDLAIHDPRRRSLRRAKVGPVEVEWGSLEEARSEAAAEKADEPPQPAPKTSPGRLADLLALAEQHPTAAVVLARQKLEHGLARALKNNGITPPHWGIYQMIGAVHSRALVSEGTVKVLHSLRNVGNEVLHMEGAVVTPARAVEYVTTAEEILLKLAAVSNHADASA